MDEWLDTVLSLLVIAAVFVVRWWVKADIERSVDKKFREWEVRFSTFHGRLVEAMEVVRGALARAVGAAKKYRSGSNFRTEDDLRGELRQVQSRLEEARLAFESRAFYFDEATRELVENLFDGLYRTIVNIRLYLRAESRGSLDRVEEHLEMVERYSEELDAAKATLDRRFRVLAGGGLEV